jgi:adenylate kinase
MIQLDDLFFEKFISKTQISEAVNGVAVKINDDYKDKAPVFLIVLNGAFFLVQISLKISMEIVK